MSFFSWINRLISQPKQADKLYPECLTSVAFDENSVRTTCETSPSREMLWSEVTRIWLHTTSEGPWVPDAWWILVDDVADSTLHFPQGVTGEDALLQEISRRFEGFKIDGMNSTKDEKFLLWQKTPQSTHA